MKFLLSFFIIMIVSFLACIYLPWWSIAIVAFFTGYTIDQRAFTSFISAFIALFILWGGLSLWISFNNDHIMAHKISLLILKADNPFLLIVVTAFLGGIVAGLGALSGNYFKKVLFGDPHKSIVADLDQ